MYIANATDVEKMAFLNNLMEYKSLGGPPKTKSGITALNQAKNLTEEAKNLQKSTEDLMGLAKSMKDEAEAGKKKALQDLDDFMETGGQPLKAKNPKFLGGSMHEEGQIRTCVREFLQTEFKNGRLKLDDLDKERIMKYSGLIEHDPIKVFKKIYGDEAYTKAGSFPGAFEKGENYKHYEQIFRENMGDEVLQIKNNEYKGDGKLILTEREEVFKPAPDDDDIPFAEGGIAGYYTGGMVDVEPSLSDIGHGSDALMARTRLVSPNSQATTSTGLNYLLAEDNDNIRVPFGNGKNFEMYLREREQIERQQRLEQLMKEYKDDMNRKKVMQQKQEAAEGGRIGFSKGKGVDLLRRGFLKTMGAAGAGIAALKTGLLSLGGKKATKEVAKEIITTPNAPGKPEWFDALVTRVIREGDDVTKTMATKDREIVYRKKIDDETDVMVTQDLDEGVTRVDIDDKVRNVTGFDDPPTVSLQVTDEIVEEGGARIKPEFKATENDYRNYATDPDGGYETEFVENTVEEVKDLTSDLTKVKSFATKKGPTMEEIVISKKKRDDVKYANERTSEYAADRGPDYDPSDYIEDMADDYASGGIARMIGE